MEVTITSTDPQGRPVPAEISLALIEQTLLDRYARPLPPIAEFFQVPYRKLAMCTTSSIDFAYHPRTPSINPLLLTEKDRIELAREETARLRESFGRGGDPVSPNGSFGGFGGGFPMAPNGTATAVGSGQLPHTNGQSPSSSFDVETERPDKPSRIAAQLRAAMLHEKADAQEGSVGGMLAAPRETAYWNPAITTDRQGKATVVIKIPAHLTTWSLSAKGVTKSSLVGEASRRIIVTKDLFGELKVPHALVNGDDAKVIARVHNDRIAQGTMNVTLTTKVGKHSDKQVRNIQVTSKGVFEIPFQVALKDRMGQRVERVEFTWERGKVIRQ